MNEKPISEMTDKELLEEYNNAKHLKVVYSTSQLVKKILLNSYYGATGSPYFSLYDKRLAQATTLTGQCFIRTVIRNASKFIKMLAQDKTTDEEAMVIAGDTDSGYLNIYPVYKKLIEDNNKTLNENERTDFYDILCKGIEKKSIEPCIADMAKAFNVFQNCLKMKRETICAGAKKTGYCGFWVAKKRYALLVNDNEGFRYVHPKLKVMGLSQVQSSTPKVCRDNLQHATKLMIEEGEEAVRKYAKEVYTEFINKKDEEIAFPRSVSDVEKYSYHDKPIKGAPVQSKAAINHNFLLKKFHLETVLQPIRDGDKLKFLYLNQNPYGFDVIGFKETLPKEFGLNKYINKDMHFEKAFKKPLTDMMNACGWELEPVSRLDEFF